MIIVTALTMLVSRYNSSTPPRVDLGRATPRHALYLPQQNDFVCQVRHDVTLSHFMT